MMLVAGTMACGLAACSDDDTTPSGNITPADRLYLPRNNARIMRVNQWNITAWKIELFSSVPSSRDTIS